MSVLIKSPSETDCIPHTIQDILNMSVLLHFTFNMQGLAVCDHAGFFFSSFSMLKTGNILKM